MENVKEQLGDIYCIMTTIYNKWKAKWFIQDMICVKGSKTLNGILKT